MLHHPRATGCHRMPQGLAVCGSISGAFCLGSWDQLRLMGMTMFSHGNIERNEFPPLKKHHWSRAGAYKQRPHRAVPNLSVLHLQHNRGITALKPRKRPGRWCKRTCICLNLLHKIGTPSRKPRYNLIRHNWKACCSMLYHTIYRVIRFIANLSGQRF